MSRNSRYVDALCAHQAEAILQDPALVEAARDELGALEGQSAWHDTWVRLLDAGPVACAAVLTSTSDAAQGLKADSPFALVVEVPAEVRRRLSEEARRDRRP